jgi:ATP-dependent RNA helicase DHX29
LPPDEEDADIAQQDVKLEKRYSEKTASTINLFDERCVPACSDVFLTPLSPLCVRLIAYDLVVRLLEKICYEDVQYVPHSSAILIFMPGKALTGRIGVPG